MREHKIVLVLFLVSMLAVALLTRTTPTSAHEFSRLGTVESLVERGTFQLDDSIFIVTVDKIQRGGHYYSHQPPLLSILEAPIYWGLHLTGMRFNNSGRLLMTYLFSLLTNGVAFAITVVLLYRILELTGVERRRRILFAALLPCGTWLLPYGLVTNNHGIAGMLLALAIYLLLAIERIGATTTRYAALGVTLGVLSAIELLPLFAFVPLITIWVLSRAGLASRSSLAFATGVVVPLVAHAVANLRITGDVIPAGFHHELFNYPGSAFDPEALTGTIKYASPTAAAIYAWQSLISGKGYFTFAPVLGLGLILGLAEWRWWSRRRGIHLVLLGGTMLSLGASILTTNNFGGEAVGFRHAAYLAPAMLTLLAPWIAGTTVAPARKLAPVAATAALSAMLMLVFAAPRPWSVLTVTAPAIGAPADYFPIAAQLLNGTLLKP